MMRANGYRKLVPMRYIRCNFTRLVKNCGKSATFNNNHNQYNDLVLTDSRVINFCQSCLNNNYLAALLHQYFRNSPGPKSTVVKQFKKEYAAAVSLLHRSGFLGKIPNPYIITSRGIHTSLSRLQNKPPNDDNKKPDNDDDKKLPSVIAKALLWMLSGYMFIALLSLIFPSSNQPEQIIRYVSWNEFVHHMLAKGEVEQIIVRPDIDIVTIILYDGAVIKGRKIEHRTFHMNIVDMKKFEEKLREAEERLGVGLENRVPVIYERGTDTAGKLLVSLILAAILLSILNRARNMRGGPMSFDYFSQLGRAKFTLVDPVAGQGKGVRFADVAGLSEAKQEVMEFVDYLKRPEFYRNLGAKVPKGALLLGPPGCGKTLLAKAVATESNVPFLSMNGSEFIEMIGGLGAARVRDLFKEGRKRSPCIIYIDEIDAIGRRRSGGGQWDGSTGEGEQTLNQLLVEMDGMASKEGVIVLASTNRADVLDMVNKFLEQQDWGSAFFGSGTHTDRTLRTPKALLRPGRFDRHILIDLPTLEERKQIFETHLKGITLEHEPSKYSHRMAYLTPGFSGADIANVCNEAALHAARSKQKFVTGANLEYAVERVVGGTEKRSHAMTPAEKRVVAYHESGHAVVGWMLPTTDALLKVTIVPRTNMALGFAQYTPKDQKLFSKEEIFERMCMALGGRVAESLTFNKITTGAQNDLQKVSQMAYAMVRQYGMSQTTGLVSFDEDKGSLKPYSKMMAALFDDEARRIVARAYQRTEQVLTENKEKLELLAETLLKKETLNYPEVEALIGPPPHGLKNLMDPADYEASVQHAAGSNPMPQGEAPQPSDSPSS